MVEGNKHRKFFSHINFVWSVVFCGLHLVRCWEYDYGNVGECWKLNAFNLFYTRTIVDEYFTQNVSVSVVVVDLYGDIEILTIDNAFC